MLERSHKPKSIIAILAFLAVVGMPWGPHRKAQGNDAVLSKYSAEVFSGPAGYQIPYRMLPPASLEKGKLYPLVLFLHGAGERGADNQKQLVHAATDFASPQRMEKYPAFVVFPQCPAEQRWVESAWDLPSGSGEFDTMPSNPMKATLALVDALVKKLPVDPARVYVTGLSMGGQGAWYAAAAKPHRFAALLEVCGGGDPTWAADYLGIPIWALHGQKDNVVPISRAREMVVALTEVGHAPELRYTEYPGVGHNSWTQTYKRDDVFEWLFAQRKP
ncbi:MAG: prolyl oligopeptidase family serine peptidase [Rubripirellula sp.]|jgi:predicted peptidase